jgi:hypothetical protein
VSYKIVAILQNGGGNLKILKFKNGAAVTILSKIQNGGLSNITFKFSLAKI